MPFVVSRVRERNLTVAPAATDSDDNIRINPPPRKRPPLGATSPAPDYTVGYARPPEHSKFKRGQSGNPKGRPKEAKGLKTLTRKILTEKVTVRTPSGPRRMSKMEAGLLKMTEKAFSGDMRALQALATLYSQSVPEERAESSGPASQDTLDEHDAAALAAFTTIVRSSITTAQDGEDAR